MTRDIGECEVLVAQQLDGWALEQGVVLLAHESSVLCGSVSDKLPNLFQETDLWPRDKCHARSAASAESEQECLLGGAPTARVQMMPT